MAYNFPSDPSLNQTHKSQGQTWTWNGVQWVSSNNSTAPLSLNVHFSNSPPQSPSVGTLWYDTLHESLKIWGNSQSGPTNEWIDITSEIPQPEPPVFISTSPPPSAETGFLWFDTIEGSLKVNTGTAQISNWVLAADCCSSYPTEVSVTVSSSPPTDPSSGALWFDAVNMSLKMWFVDIGGTSRWVETAQMSQDSISPVLISTSPPQNPLEGYLWYDTLNETLKVWAVGPLGGYWIAINPQADRAPPPVRFSSAEPSNPPNGSFWYDTVNNKLYLRDNNPPGEWIPILDIAGNPQDCTKTTISSTPPPNPSPGDFWYDCENSNLNLWYVDMDGGQWISVVPYPQELVTTQGGTFEGPVFAGYSIPNSPLAFVTVKWVEDYIAAHGTVVPITDLPDVNDAGLTDKSTLVYDSATAIWQTDITILDITNGGTY